MTATTYTSGACAPTSLKATRPKRPGFLAHLVAARARAAELHTRRYLSGLSDERLADLGFTAEDIARIRRSGSIAADFTR
jgi:uncharacterized protein YjiS (DUF1127 family)